MNVEQQAPMYEVGWMYEGIPTEEDKREALTKMLSLYGSDPSRWVKVPEIREEKTRSIPTDFGRGPIKVQEYKWAIYGVLKDQPVIGYVPEGVRLPSVKDVRLG